MQWKALDDRRLLDIWRTRGTEENGHGVYVTCDRL